VVSKRKPPKPRWLKPARDPVRCGGCGWQVRSGHSPGCPRHYYALTTAEQIADARVALMIFADVQRHQLGIGQAVAGFAIALSGRARELGLERDEAGDFDHMPALRTASR
jgi:hypothetical protein